MTQISIAEAATSRSRQQVEATFTAHPPMTREQAAEHLKAQGVVPGQDGRMAAAPPARAAADYTVPADSPIAAHDLAKLAVDPLLARVLVADLAARPPDVADVEAHIQRTGQSYKALLGDVVALCTSNGVTINAAHLSANGLSALAAFARHRARKA
jgi:hypothetical protein